MHVQGRSCSVLEVTEQQPKLLKKQVQMFSSHATFAREIHSRGEGGKRWDPSMQTLQKISKEMLLQRMVRGLLTGERAAWVALLLPCFLRDHKQDISMCVTTMLRCINKVPLIKEQQRKLLSVSGKSAPHTGMYTQLAWKLPQAG